MTTDPDKAPVPPGIKWFDETRVQEGIAALNDADVHDLKLVFLWGVTRPTSTRSEYAHTQLNTLRTTWAQPEWLLRGQRARPLLDQQRHART